MDRDTFEGLVKDALASMYDAAALETHPQLFGVFKPPATYTGRKGEYIRQVLTQAIEQLRPERKEINVTLPEWRPYVILQRRYLEGVGLHDLAGQLSISDRQLRRDQHRAVRVLAVLLWNQLYPDQPAQWDEIEPAEETPLQFEIHEETIDLPETLRAVHQMLAERLHEVGMQVGFDFPEPAALVATDRIILRQILISLFNDAMRTQPGGEWLARVSLEGPFVTLTLQGPAGEARQTARSADEEEGLGTLRMWSERIKARFEESVDVQGGVTSLRRVLSLPRAGQRVILVVDDQAPAINLFKRYLSHTPMTIVGVSKADEVLPMARQLLPAVITLDVMMPKLDGWEVLQMLKLDETTRSIPVIVCSAWEEAELSRSLRAAGFLKKPVTQKDLLDALDRLGILAPP